MTIQGPSALYSQGFGTTFEKVEIPVVTNRAPTSADGINPPMPLGKRWIDMSGNRSYSLTSFNSAGGVVTSNWQQNGGGGAGGISTITTDDSAVVSPVGGNINLAGASPLSTSGSGDTVTLNLASPLPVANGGTADDGTSFQVNGLVYGSGRYSVISLKGINPGTDGQTLLAHTDSTPTWENISLYAETPYVVGPLGQAGYQTIQSALDAANAAGGGTVAIQPGTYTEDLTLYSEVFIVGNSINSLNENSGIVIEGTHTLPLSGWISFQGVSFLGGTSLHVFTQSAETTVNIFLNKCFTKVTDSSANVFNIPLFAGSLEVNNCTDDSQAATFLFINTPTPPSNNPIVEIYYSVIYGAINFTSTGGGLLISYSICSNPVSVGGSIVLEPLSSFISSIVSVDSTEIFLKKCALQTNSECINATTSGPVLISDCSMSSGATYAITGTSSISLANITFDGSTSAINPTITANWLPSGLGTTYITGGNLNIATDGGKINITGGSANSCFGTSAAMTTGTVIVTTTAVTANSMIIPVVNTLGTVTKPQAIYPNTIIPGTSFVLTSADATDTSTVNWWLFN